MCVILNRVRALTLTDRQVQAEENEVVWHSYPLPSRVISTDSARECSRPWFVGRTQIRDTVVVMLRVGHNINNTRPGDGIGHTK